MPRYIALIPAAGSGARLGSNMPKQYLPIGGRPMILRTIEALARVREIDEIVVLLGAGDRHWALLNAALPDKLRTLSCGGATRAATVRNALEQLVHEVEADDWILVHDAARPCVDPRRVEMMIAELKDDAVGGLLALPAPDTIKRGRDGRVVETVPRDDLWLAQTPQMFRYRLLREALARLPHNAATDEAQAVEAMGQKPRLIAGDAGNLKVTYAEDIALAEAILGSRVDRGA